MALKDSECALSAFAVAATGTSGQVNVLHPLEWAAEVQRIAQNPIIATNVHTRLLLPPCFANARGQQQDCAQCSSFKGTNNICVNVGNATADSDISLGFDFIPKKERINSVPFQLQITLDGAQYMRVISADKEISAEREKAEKELDIAVVGVYAAHRAAELALQAKFEEARNLLFGYSCLMKRAATTPTQQEELSAFTHETEELERILRKDPGILKDDTTAKMLHRAMAAPLTQFLSGSRKNVGRREQGVFSDGELREWYYNKKF